MTRSECLYRGQPVLWLRDYGTVTNPSGGWKQVYIQHQDGRREWVSYDELREASDPGRRPAINQEERG